MIAGYCAVPQPHFTVSVTYTQHPCGREFADLGVQSLPKPVRRLVLSGQDLEEIDGCVFHPCLLTNVGRDVGVPCPELDNLCSNPSTVRLMAGKLISPTLGSAVGADDEELIKLGKYVTTAILYVNRAMRNSRKLRNAQIAQCAKHE